MPRRPNRVSDSQHGETNPLVSVLLFETVTGYQRVTGGAAPTSVYVNKIAPLVAMELQDEGHSLPLPYAWYKFGPEVLVHSLGVRYSPILKGAGSAPEPTGYEAEYQTLAEWRWLKPEGFEHDRTADLIREKVNRLLRQYAIPNQPELLVDRAYERAPFDFQRAFRMVRMNRGRTGLGSALHESAQKADLWTLVHDAFEVFPKDRFHLLRPAGEATRELVNYTWNRITRRDAKTAADALEQYWAVFASFLRLDPLGHSSAVSRSDLEYWQELADRDLTRFNRAVGDLTLHVARDEPGILEDAVLGPIGNRRIEERKEADEAIDFALEDADELRELLSQAKGGSMGG